MNIKRYGFGVAFSILCSLGAVEAMAADIITPLGNDAAAGARAPARQVTVVPVHGFETPICAHAAMGIRSS